MSRFRHLLLCLMLLALPLQGFAAASMLYCSMGAGHAVKAEQSEMSSGRPQIQMVDAIGTAHDHAKHGKTAQTAKQSSDGQKQLPDAAHTCGVCAACCSVIAIADFPQTVAVQLSPKADLAEPIVLIDTVPSRLPEKPPRA